MALANEIRNLVAQYTSGTIDAAKLRGDLLAALRDAYKSHDKETKKFVHDVEWVFLDLERRGRTSETDLKAALARLMEASKVTFKHTGPVMTTTCYIQEALELATTQQGNIFVHDLEPLNLRAGYPCTGCRDARTNVTSTVYSASVAPLDPAPFVA